MANGRCRFHGGASTGAPTGNINALCDGDYTAAAIAQRKSAATLRRALNAKIKLTMTMARLGQLTQSEGELRRALDAEITGALAKNREANVTLSTRRTAALARLRRRDR